MSRFVTQNGEKTVCAAHQYECENPGDRVVDPEREDDDPDRLNPEPGDIERIRKVVDSVELASKVPKGATCFAELLGRKNIGQ